MQAALPPVGTIGLPRVGTADLVATHDVIEKLRGILLSVKPRSGPADLLVLNLWDARGMLEGDGLVGVGRALAGVGLEPVVGQASGSPSLSSDNPLFWSGIEIQDTPERGRLRPIRTWACRLTTSSGTVPSGFALFEAGVLSPAVNTVQITLGPPVGNRTDTVDAWSSWAGLLLEQAGTALYEHVHPVLAAITTVAPGRPAPWRNDLVRRVIDDNQLVVGWRTWFSPERVEIHGRDVLMDIPDMAWALEDGGIGHGLGAPASALVRGQREIFAGVWDYADTRRLTLAWPRAATRPAPAQPEQPSTVGTLVTPQTQLEELIRQYLRPRLRKAGFRAAGPTFRRMVSGNWQIVNVQWDSRPIGSIRFAINLGVASRRAAAADIEGWETRHLSHWECDLHWRLGALVHNGHDHWWSIDAQTPLAPLGNQLVQYLESAAFPQLDKYASDEAIRDQWLAGRSTGLSWSIRLRLRRLLAALGPRELLDEIPLEDEEGDRKRAEEHTAWMSGVLRDAGFEQIAGKPNEWLAPPDWPEQAKRLREQHDSPTRESGVDRHH